MAKVLTLLCLLLGTLACQDTEAVKYRRDPMTGSDDATPEGENLSNDSLAAFQASVYPVVKSHCATCHGSFQAPLFAVEEAATAHKNLLESAKVDLQQPDRSRLVIRLRDDKHNCWSECETDAQTVLDEIMRWASAMEPPEMSTALLTTELTIPQAIDMLPRNTDSRTIVMEAEFLLRQGALKAESMAGASDSMAVGLANTGADPEKFATFDVSTDIVSTKVNVPVDGNYQLYVRAKAPSANDDELYYRFADTTFTSMALRRTNGDAWAWTAVNANSAGTPSAVKALTAGEHEIEFRRSEAGVYIDMVAVSSDTNFRNSPLGGQRLVKGLQYDISAMCNTPDVILEIEVLDFNADSYKFMSPRIRSATKAVHVQGLDVLVNGVTNAQYATFRLVNQIVKPGDYSSQLLSGGALLVLKENGPEADRFAFALRSCAPVE